MWVLRKIGSEPFILPVQIKAFEDEILALCREEKPLVHGSRDILGDGWLKFRRVATKFKKAHPTVPKRVIFKAVVWLADRV